MLVVWEPILPTDWRAPGSLALRRISDQRAIQFCDPKHQVVLELQTIAKKHPEQSLPKCCARGGYFWDDALLYAPGSDWGDSTAAFFDGPVVRVIPDLERRSAKSPNSATTAGGI